LPVNKAMIARKIKREGFFNIDKILKTIV